jgi:hypothetical protein
VVFEFLKKKLQSTVAPVEEKPASPADEYEARRSAAESLYKDGRVDDAIHELERLASDLAGAGNFPLAVAVRHQIHQWRPDRDTESAEQAGLKMAMLRNESGVFKRPALPPELLAPQSEAPAPEPPTTPIEVPSAALPVAPPTEPEPAVARLATISPLFQELNAEEIAALIETTGRVSYPAGTAVVEEGSSGDHLYIVTRGTFGVTTGGHEGRSVRVGTLSVGDFFGEVALLTGKPRAATVTAEADAECLQITSENWNLLAAKHPRLWQLLEEAIAVRAELTAEAVVDDLRRRRTSEPA